MNGSVSLSSFVGLQEVAWWSRLYGDHQGPPGGRYARNAGAFEQKSLEMQTLGSKSWIVNVIRDGILRLYAPINYISQAA